MEGIKVSPFHGALLLPGGEYRIFAPAKVYENTCEPASCIERGSGVDRAHTDDIKSCLGFVLQEQGCSLLAHAYSPANLEVLLDAMLPAWEERVRTTPLLHLASRAPSALQRYAKLEQYQPIISKYLPKSRSCWHPVESWTKVEVGVPLPCPHPCASAPGWSLEALVPSSRMMLSNQRS